MFLRQDLHVDVMRQVIRQTSQTDEECESDSTKNLLNQHLHGLAVQTQMDLLLFRLLPSDRQYVLSISGLIDGIIFDDVQGV